MPIRPGYTRLMEETTTPEGLVRRTLLRTDGRFVNFYNTPGEEQPVIEDAAQVQPAHADPDTMQPNRSSAEAASNV